MNLYHCMIDLKNDAKVMVFAKALEDWLEHLKTAGQLGSWRLLRRKLNLASDAHRDFLLEVEVESLSDLDELFHYVCRPDDEIAALYDKVHKMIERVAYGLYREFPDPQRVERAALL